MIGCKCLLTGYGKSSKDGWRLEGGEACGGPSTKERLNKNKSDPDLRICAKINLIRICVIDLVPRLSSVRGSIPCSEIGKAVNSRDCRNPTGRATCACNGRTCDRGPRDA